MSVYMHVNQMYLEENNFECVVIYNYYGAASLTRSLVRFVRLWG